MKVLLDSCVSPQAQLQLEAAGHDVVWMGSDADPGDEEIMRLAHAQDRVLVTLDKDFGTLAVLHEKPHCGIIRLVRVSSTQQGLVCLQALQDHENELRAGAILTVLKDRVRRRPGKGR